MHRDFDTFVHATASGPGRLPDLLLLGAMKSGSTTLHDQLSRHTDVYAHPRVKEPGFFSRDERFAMGIEKYKTLFAGAEPHQLCLESSTCYTRYPHFGDVAKRIHEHLPDVRMLYIMRHPVLRAHSHYKHAMLEREGPPVSFEQALAQSEEYVDASLYLEQIEQYLRFYPRERFHFLLLDDLKRDPQGVLRGVQEFLGLPVQDDLADPKVSNAIEDRISQRQASKQLQALRGNPVLAIAKRVTPGFVRRAVRSTLASAAVKNLLVRRTTDDFSQQLSPLTSETRTRLLQRFEGPNRALEAFLGRKLPDSWYV